MCNYCKECSPNSYRHGVLIRKAAKECYNALILLRSANKFNEHNLIPIGLRKTLVGAVRGMMVGREGHGGL